MELGIQLLQASDRVFDAQENKLLEEIDTLSSQHSHLQIGTQVLHTLTQAMKTKGECDLNQDEELKRLVLCIHRLYPYLFDSLIQGFPEGVLSQPIEPSSPSAQGIIDAALQGVDLNEVKIQVLKKEDLDALIPGLEKELEIKAAEVNQTSFSINRIYGDREQMVKIMHEILRQLNECLRHINGNARGA